MRIAVISDVHGNLPALEAVLKHIVARAVDQIVNLGDILSGPLYPRETAARLRALNLVTIQGNHERQLLTQTRARMNLSDGYAADCLASEDFVWLRGLPSKRCVHDEVLLVHGTEASDVAPLLHTLSERGLRAATPDELDERTSSTRARVVLCGHTHLPGIARLDDGRMLVNPGSVGLQAYRETFPHAHVVETGSPHARYAIIERRAGAWSAELFAVDYEFEISARQAQTNNRLEWASALRTGFA